MLQVHPRRKNNIRNKSYFLVLQEKKKERRKKEKEEERSKAWENLGGKNSLVFLFFSKHEHDLRTQCAGDLNRNSNLPEAILEYFERIDSEQSLII